MTHEPRTCLFPDCPEVMHSGLQIRCAAHARQARNDRQNEKRHVTPDKLIGAMFPCKKCKKPAFRHSANQKYCSTCQPIAFREQDLKSHNARNARNREQFTPIKAGDGVQPLREKLSTSARLQRNIDRIVRAARMPGYDEHRPEKFIKQLEATAC